ncbi:MAG: thioredoxin domain-containing protein [Oligoflexia bacterium]|nr:thioredoxin domain-containing protein [Oligoflexia bacterium]
MKIVSMLLMLSLLATSCVKKDDVAKVLKENPEILADAIKANPVQFLEAIQFAAENAKKEMAKKREEDEKKKFEEAFNNPLEPQIRKDEMIRGPKNAPITLVEYSDFQCPFCQRGFNNVQALLKKYGKNIRFIYKHLPLSFHKEAMITAQYHEAIRLQSEEKAWAFHDEIFKDIQRLRMGEKFLKKIAKKVGANQKRIDKDKSSAAVMNRIKEDQAEAAKFGMQGTPGFLLNGIPLRGAYPVSEFDKIIDRLVKDGKIKLN